jgi:branched-chain amino acid transport system substrate-binding protein
MPSRKADDLPPDTLPLTRRGFLEKSGIAAGVLILSGKQGFAAESGTVNIGVMGPFSGPAAQTGDQIKKGTQLALEDARAAGELPLRVGDKTLDINIVWIDDESDPEKGVRALASAIEQDKVRLIVTGWTANIAIAAMKLEAQHKVIHVGYMSGAQTVADVVNKDPARYTGYFEGYPVPASMSGLYGPPLEHFMKEGLWKPRSKKAGLLIADTDYFRAWGEAVGRTLSSIGLEPLPMDVVAQDTTEFAPLLLKYKAKGVSLVAFGCLSSVSTKNFLQQFHSSGNKALLLTEGLTWFSDWQKLTGETSEYALTMDSPYAISPEQNAWIERFKAKYGAEPSIGPSGWPYDYMRMAISVANKAGSLDYDVLLKAFVQYPHQGVWNYLKFSTEKNAKAPSPHSVEVGAPGEGFFVPLAQVQSGKPEVIWPLKYATQQFKAPPGVNG